MAEAINYSGFVDRLKSRKDQLPPKLQAVAHYILNNPDDIAILSISKIAMAAGVQPSAVTRFTRELGLTGFSELQSVFRERKRRWTPILRLISPTPMGCSRLLPGPPTYP